MPLIVVLDGDVMRGVDQVDGGVMVGDRHKDEGKTGGQSLRILVVIAVLGKILLFPAILMRNPC